MRASQKRRREALQKLADEYGIDPHDHNTTAGEDLAEYLLEGERIEQWVAVTGAGDYVYLYPRYATIGAARSAAFGNVADSLYAEYPLEVVNLDTGERWAPDWPTLRVDWTPRRRGDGTSANLLSDEGAGS
jgi:hypothetical protein